MKSVAFLVFPNVEDLDLVGPWQVLTTAGVMTEKLKCYTVAKEAGTLQCSKGLRIIPDKTLSEMPKPDILLVPGGRGVDDALNDSATMEWVTEAAKTAEWVTSVCSGALMLLKAGPAQGRRITTHSNRIAQAREMGGAKEVVENIRYVDDGNVVSSAGVSAGIDMALWLTGQIFSPDFAIQVQKRMEYTPLPPYQDLWTDK
ncbi:DJ-1/PfpI family protein [Stappia sp. GBMRC 2046]|uniref:DJ-1/PfpI family protein n=1 Tax=Stappia sediminis TaxID=2692190 RepID=A0A7X3S729_9HYPH|nr:DJ-1/PfpI family protein [Stappia sediminis]MXN64408.1 DJ-1/PfpI family protein [Stappia sediminis]